MAHAYFNSAFTTVADAMATGNCTHIPNAMAYKVLTDTDTHKATGVLYIDRDTREPREVHAKAVVLCAQALESARILLNSASRQDPGGLGNSSGVLGKYLMDHIWVGGGARAEFPDLSHAPSLDGPNRPNGIYIPRFQNTRTSKSPAFRRGYGFQGGEATTFRWKAPGFGEIYKKGVTRARHHHRPRRVRRVPALRGQLRRDRQGGRGHLRHPRPAHQHELP